MRMKSTIRKAAGPAVGCWLSILSDALRDFDIPLAPDCLFRVGRTAILRYSELIMGWVHWIEV